MCSLNMILIKTYTTNLTTWSLDNWRIWTWWICDIRYQIFFWEKNVIHQANMRWWYGQEKRKRNYTWCLIDHTNIKPKKSTLLIFCIHLANIFNEIVSLQCRLWKQWQITCWDLLNPCACQRQIKTSISIRILKIWISHITSHRNCKFEPHIWE